MDSMGSREAFLRHQLRIVLFHLAGIELRPSLVKIKKNGTGSINSFDSQPCFNEITIKLLDSGCDSNKELEEIKVVPLVGASTTMLAREDKKFDIQSRELKQISICLFSNLPIFNIFAVFSQYQYQY